ncbi:MAG: NADPH-dependent glutamate synthase [bacterium]
MTDNEKKPNSKINPKKTPIPEQSANERRQNFDEVAIGYDSEMAKNESLRCLQCKKPTCIAGCPVGIDIPEFLKFAAEGDFESGYKSLKKYNALPAVCGRVCPQENQCEKVCVLAKKFEPVGIGRVERYLADWYLKKHDMCPRGENMISRDDKIAVVGCGPASITCAGELAQAGFPVTVYEALHELGGVMVYGIPEFRLPNAIVRAELNMIADWGVNFEPNVLVGNTITLKDIFGMGFKSVFLGTGAGLPYFLNIPGEYGLGIYSSNEYLTRINLMRANRFPEYDTPVLKARRVTVIGGGNTAMDSARISIRLKDMENVTIAYRRSRVEMPARAEEAVHAEEEGIDLMTLVAPKRYILDDDHRVCAMELIKMQLGEPDDRGRRRPFPIEGSEFIHETDLVVVAVGQGPNPLLMRANPEIETSKWGTIIVNEETMMTSMKGVFAGGDIVTGGATIISAMGAGKTAAAAMRDFVDNN